MDFAQPAVPRINGYQDPHMIVDPESQIVQLDGLLVRLTQKEFDLLSFLIEHSGELIPRSVLLARVWGYTSAAIRTRTLDVHVRRIRAKLGHYGATYIETVFGVGYRFQPYRSQAQAQIAAASALAAADSRPAAEWRWRMAGNPPN